MLTKTFGKMFSKVIVILIITVVSNIVYSANYNAIVAKDGSGHYKTVQEAIDHAPGTTRFIIFIKSGTYLERIHVNKKYVTLIGQDVTKTISTNKLYASMKENGIEIGTYKTASVFINSDEFQAGNITFSNTAGKTAGQALAIRVDGDKVVFRSCRFLGWQDTVLVNKGEYATYFIFTIE